MVDCYRESLERRISDAYLNSGNRLGWRLLYSSAAVLDGAKVALIGLNPGGSANDPNHAEFAMANGSAYEVESWAGARCGQAPLQRQVQELFRLFDVPAAEVLAGNLVPFRSPNWSALVDREAALAFGYAIWREMIDRAAPSVVISLGKEANRLVADLLKVTEMQSCSVNWGTQNLYVGKWRGGRWLGLPHLSQYKIMHRPESRPALDWAMSRMKAGEGVTLTA